MIDFYLSVNNRATVIQLPVPPAEFTVEKPQGNETFETASKGWVKLIGATDLKSISFSSFFPVKDYPFLRNRTMWGFSYVELLDRWKNQKLPIRLTINTGGISFPCVVDDFSYSVGTTGDINYDITFGEFPLLSEGGDELLSKEYEHIMGELVGIKSTLDTVANPKTYNYINDIPDWAKETVQKLYNKGALTGTGDNLELSHDMIRTLVILDRVGAF